MRGLRWIMWRRWRRRVCAGLTLLSYLLATFGMPLPASARSHGDQRFPCENNPCGCLTAEQCWTSCCCNTPAQRLAWARANNVQPPSYAAQPKPISWRTEPRGSKPHDRNESPGNYKCCDHQSAPEACCQAPESDDEGGTDQAAPEQQSIGKSGTSWRLGVAALKCKGLAMLWASTGAALPPLPPSAWTPPLGAGDWLSVADLVARVLLHTPPDPPPRLAA